MKLSAMLDKFNIKQLFFMFFNLGTENSDEYFEFKVMYRKSKKTKIDLTESIKNENNCLMSSYIDMNFNRSGNTHLFRLENDMKFTRKNFLNEIYKRIEQSRFKYSNKEFQEALYMGLFAFRGTMDLNHMLYAVDLLNANISNDYLNHIASLLISSSGAKQLNLNFRELQPEYFERKRNTQVRVNLRWFYDTYIDILGRINKYKAEILKENYSLISHSNISVSVDNVFIERLLFYRDRIVKKSLKFDKLSAEQQKVEINLLREVLDFAAVDNDDSISKTRNQSIVQMASAFLPNECVGCKDTYNLMDRTFLRKNSEVPYLEIHHVISFGTNNNSDVLENLVKLCPACHRALTPNRACDSYQKELIKKIISNSPVVRDYLDNFMASNYTEDDKIDFVYENLM